VGAIERTLAKSLRQRCLIHRCRNLLAKIPAHARAEVKVADSTGVRRSSASFSDGVM
jgi:transposase-like protein